MENPGKTFLLWNVNKGIFLSAANKLWVHVLMAKYCGGDEMEGCTDELTPLNMKTDTANSGMSSAIRNPRRPDSLVSVCQSVISQLILLPLTSIIY